MSWLRVGSIVLMAAFAAAGWPGARAASPVAIGVSGLASANASIATSGSFVGVAWAARTKDGVTDIYATTVPNAGRSFRAPVRVNQVAGAANVSGEQPPRVVLIGGRAGEPAVAVMWTEKAPAGTRIVTAGSGDGGRSFDRAEAVPGTGATGNRGWESMAVRPNGELVALWLDHRDVPARPSGSAPMSGGHEHGGTSQHPSPDSMARAQLSQIFFANLNDAKSARAIAPGVCYCCKTSVATGADGSIVASWRHVYPGNIRDIALTKSTDGGRTFTAPVRVSEDNWALDVCPENGPAVGIDLGNAIHVVWPTLVQEQPARNRPWRCSMRGPAMARASRSGSRFQPRVCPAMRKSRSARPGGIIVAWDEQVNGARRIVVADAIAGDSSGVKFIRRPIGDASGNYPVVAAVPGAAVVAWTAGPAGDTVIRVERFPMQR